MIFLLVFEPAALVFYCNDFRFVCSNETKTPMELPVDGQSTTMTLITEFPRLVLQDENPPIPDSLSPGITDFLRQCFKKVSGNSVRLFF